MNIHSNARTCPKSRAVIVDHVRARAWSEDQAAAMGISARTGFKWWRRYREAGLVGLFDRSSRPHRIPNLTSPERTELVLQLRRSRLTAREIAAKLRMPRSTVSAILKRHGMSRLHDLDPPEPVIRYEYAAPGDMLHLDVKKLARIRGVGHRITGDRSNRHRGVGWECVHVAVDDYSRLAYVEVLANEEAETTARFLRRALVFYRCHGIRVKRLLTDNAKTYGSHLVQELCIRRGIRHRTTKPYRPRTNGKAERFIQTMIREWAYKRPIPRPQGGPLHYRDGFTDTTTVDHTVVLAENLQSPGWSRSDEQPTWKAQLDRPELETGPSMTSPGSAGRSRWTLRCLVPVSSGVLEALCR
jgi:transposase InsO family protein